MQGRGEHEEWAAWTRARDPICCSCRLAATRVADHITPTLIGGEATDENGQGLCHDCRTAKRTEERALYPLFRSAVDGVVAVLERLLTADEYRMVWVGLVEERGLDLRTLKPREAK